MSTFYLVDPHVPVIANARIVDTILTRTPTAEFRCDGLLPIKVPEGVKIDNPSSLSDLLTQKYAGILAQFPGFSNVLFDDLLDPSGVQLVAPPSRLRKSGSRGTIGGTFRTAVSAAVATVTQAILVYEHYTWRYVDSRDGRLERYYIEQPEADFTAGLRVKAGSTFQTTTSGSLVTFLLADQGTAVQAEFLASNPSAYVDDRLVHTGSWAVIY